MPPVPARVPGGVDPAGGVRRYPLEWLHEEVAYIAYHFHWPYDQIMGLEHHERRRWVEEIAEINRRANAAQPALR
jgi:hypothetical protein